MKFKLSRNAIHYTLEQLFTIAGIKIQINESTVTFDEDHSMVSLQIADNKKIVIKLMNENDISNLFDKKLIFKKIVSFDDKMSVPAFFSFQADSFASFTEEALYVNVDILTLSFILLARVEELIVRERDKHNRFKYQSSLSYFYDFIHIPVVDEYAMLLKKSLMLFLPGIDSFKEDGKIIPTHDIDMILRFGNIFRNIETIVAGDLIRQKSPSLAMRSVKQCMAYYKDRRRDPLLLAISDLIKISKDHKLQSTFYFKGLVEGQYDCTYDVFIPEVKYCMDQVFGNGMEVGMHAGYNSHNDIARFQKQKENLESVFQHPVISNRQHFLQFDIDNSIEIWEKSGIRYDSTLAFAEHEGFRCGTSHSYSLFNIKKDVKSNVVEYPLIIMESSLFYHRKLDIDQAFMIFYNLYERCVAMNGNFIILWHNHYMIRNYEKLFRSVYLKFIDKYAN